MKQRIFITLMASSLCILTGCVSKNTEVSTQVAKVGKDWTQVKSEQQYRTEDVKVVKEKQLIKEKIRCVGKKGRKLPVSTAEECIEQGGTVIDEVKTDETIIEQ